ncbi:MAG: diacylglycerol kinase, partial [Chitinophagaceae bacterium]|nr:diacylglycerol kinase [Rubrivivax sp.]
GRQFEILVADKTDSLDAVLQRAARLAQQHQGALVAAGGDGTINTVAQAAHEVGCPMGVVPQGTFNYFSRTHHIPLETEAATLALLEARPTPVQVGEVNGRVFLVNASLGLYPELLEDREKFKSRFGRYRGVAMFSALTTVLREHRQLRLRIESAGQVRDVRTPTLFVGNNRLQLQQVGLPEARAIEHGRVAGVMLKPMGNLALLRLLLRGAMGTLGEDDRVESFEFERMTVSPWLPYGTRRAKVAADGEVSWMRSPLTFGVSTKPLHLLKAPDAAAPL